MKSNFLLVVIVVLVAGCAASREGVEKNNEFSEFSFSSDRVDFDQVLESYSESRGQEMTQDANLQQKMYEEERGERSDNLSGQGDANWGRQIEYNHNPENWGQSQ